MNKDELIELAKRLAKEHWAWVESVLANRQKETQHMFIEGFIHGFKHGLQKREEKTK